MSEQNCDDESDIESLDLIDDVLSSSGQIVDKEVSKKRQPLLIRLPIDYVDFLEKESARMQVTKSIYLQLLLERERKATVTKGFR